ncbi:MAG: DnaB-like helicase C-terminal domain-containing protein, partial [SAR324 cluster bacterium]|nr:DnaB-like helicase C-terminal domain-containing protein [SAR324 cluster bacterium]
DLIVLGSRPSMGKSALALNISLNAAVKTNMPVIFFSLELPKRHVTIRLLSSEGRIDSHKFYTGRLENKDWDKLSLASPKIMEAPLLIDDNSGASPMHVENVARQVQSKYGEIGLIVIDFLQLMKKNPNSSKQRIPQALKSIAQEFNTPVLLLSEVKRKTCRRKDKRPRISDLKGKGNTEPIADVIMFLYRDEVYNELTDDQGIAEIIVAKHKNGEIGTKRVAFAEKYTKFANLSIREYVD